MAGKFAKSPVSEGGGIVTKSDASYPYQETTGRCLVNRVHERPQGLLELPGSRPGNDTERINPPQ